MPFAVIWMDLETVIHSEVRERPHHMISLIYIYRILKKKKNSTSERIHKTEVELQM